MSESELTAAEKTEIRKWAWDQVRKLEVKNKADQFQSSDDIAAWVMSGKLPEASS